MWVVPASSNQPCSDTTKQVIKSDPLINFDDIAAKKYVEARGCFACEIWVEYRRIIRVHILIEFSSVPQVVVW